MKEPVKDFAKIIPSSDGHQVLFYKDSDDQGPCLHQVTEVDGACADLKIGFRDSSKGWNALNLAFEAMDQQSADEVHNLIKKAMA